MYASDVERTYEIKNASRCVTACCWEDLLPRNQGGKRNLACTCLNTPPGEPAKLNGGKAAASANDRQARRTQDKKASPTGKASRKQGGHVRTSIQTDLFLTASSRNRFDVRKTWTAMCTEEPTRSGKDGGAPGTQEIRT